uniref:Uncharacterized protein n=1 Tax=Sphaerodactylus townsendi TaxID=933632 RepID=A0ACB8EBI5_9SAUR
MLPEESLMLLLPPPEQAPPDAYPRLHAQTPAAPGPEPVAVPYGSKGAAAKFLIPYQVTPSRVSGPSPAERRLEALTLELEKELEMHTAKKEYPRRKTYGSRSPSRDAQVDKGFHVDWLSASAM